MDIEGATLQWNSKTVITALRCTHDALRCPHDALRCLLYLMKNSY